MKLKYIGTLVTSVGLVMTAAAVSAQQDSPRRETAEGAVDYGTRKVPVKSPGADAFSSRPEAEPAVQTPRYASDDDLAPVQRTDAYERVGVSYYAPIQRQQDEMAQAEAGLAHKANEFRAALERAKDDTQRADIRSKLAKTLGDQFDLRQKRHNLEIEALEKQVTKLKELVRKRQESRSKIISRRVEEIQREVDGLGW